MKKHIVWVTDWNLNNSGEPQSGYTQISDVFCTQLAKDYKITALGISYRRNQNLYTFSLTNVPFAHIPSAILSINNYKKVDHLVVALDIQMQKGLLKIPRKELKYHGIFAVEGDPLYYPWVIDISQMDSRFSISEFGKNEIVNAGLDGEHLIVPVDRNIWKPRTVEEKNSIKNILGLQNKTVLFINADGNERKNISAVIEAIVKLKQWGKDNFHLVILTQKKSPIAWDLDELSNRFELQKDVTVLDRGLGQEEVRRLYAGADFFLNITKAEGMSYPILEAMSVGVPVICTNATAMKDHVNGLNKKCAIGLDADFVHIDVFGNSNRYYVFPQTIAENLASYQALLDTEEINNMVSNATEYIEWRNNQNSVDLLQKAFESE